MYSYTHACIPVHLCKCICACMSTWRYQHRYAYVAVCCHMHINNTYIHEYTRVHIQSHMHMHVNMHTYVYDRTEDCTYTCVYVTVYVCVPQLCTAVLINDFLETRVQFNNKLDKPPPQLYPSPSSIPAAPRPETKSG